MLTSLMVPNAILRELIEHAERESPREAVGMLGGCGTLVRRAIALRNRATDPHTFFADPYEQYLAERSLARESLEIVALYHSHPAGPALPSTADQEFLAIWPCAQVLIAPPLIGSTQHQIRAYCWADASFLEIPILTE